MKKLIFIFPNQPQLVRQLELEYENAIKTNDIELIKELDAMLLFSIRILLYQESSNAEVSYVNIWFN